MYTFPWRKRPSPLDKGTLFPYNNKCKVHSFTLRRLEGVEPLGKNLDVAVLLDFYGGMLTEKQRDVIDLYYNQDLSLSEIAEHESITRQGVRDSIKRGEVFLYELEDKLQMFDTYIETMKVLQSIQYVADRIAKENNTYLYSNAVRENVEQILSIINEYRARYE